MLKAGTALFKEKSIKERMYVKEKKAVGGNRTLSTGFLSRSETTVPYSTVKLLPPFLDETLQEVESEYEFIRVMKSKIDVDFVYLKMSRIELRLPTMNTTSALRLSLQFVIFHDYRQYVKLIYKTFCLLSSNSSCDCFE